MVAKQLSIIFLANSNLIDVFQSAYRANHSLETALLNVRNDLLQAMNCGMITLLVLLDLSAAFETVDHPILLSCIISYFGIGGVALDGFQSYLSGRIYCLCIGNVTSDTPQLKYGLPQGYVLGPILFSMADIIRKHEISLLCRRYHTLESIMHSQTLMMQYSKLKPTLTNYVDGCRGIS